MSAWRHQREHEAVAITEQSRTRLMIVDDDEGMRETLSDILFEKGFDVCSATTGKDALDLAMGDPVHVFLVDLDLPDMNGIYLLKQLKAMDKKRVCIIITGHASLQNAINAVNDGADAYFVKPVNIDEILLNLKYLLEKQRLQQQLEESEQKFRGIAEHSAIGIIIIQDTVIKYVNNKAASMLGIPMNELESGTLDTLSRHLHPDDMVLIDRVKDVVSLPGLEGPTNITARVIRNQNDVSWIDSHLCKIPFQGKDAVSLSLVDVTEKVYGEQRLREFINYLEGEVRVRKKHREVRREQKKYLDQLLKASKFKTDFMANMSHELRTPLNAIIGFTELIQEDWYGNLNPDQQDFILNINDAAQHLLAMINQLLDISKIEAGKMRVKIEPVVLNDVVERAEELIRPLCMKKGLSLVVSGRVVPLVVDADRVLLKEIFVNLLSNAVKYTEHGSISIIITEKENHVEVSIKDTGIGIAPEDHERVFKEFERIETPLSMREPGTGLGLSLTRRLVHLHGGELTLASALAEGSTFTFTLLKHKDGESRGPDEL